MPAYIDVPVDTDPQDVAQDAYTFLQATIPGWEPNVGNLDTWIIQAFASAAAESRDVASRVPTSIFRWFGANLVGIQPVDAASATATVRFTAQDNAGYTIPANTIVGIDSGGAEQEAFQTTNDVVIPNGITFADIAVTAVTPGAAASGLGGLGVAITLITPLSYITSVVLQTATTGGIDAEDDGTYLNRLAAELTLLAPRPILPNDFAILARTISGVYRAVAIDGYNPANGTGNNPRMVTVAAIDQQGQPVSSTIKNAVQSYLDAQREVNFTVNMVDAQVFLIDVTYNVKAQIGVDPVALITAVNAAIQSYLNPATWGSTDEDAQDWINTPTIRYLELATVINNVPGVDYITTTAGNYDLQVAIHGQALGRTDVPLTGVTPLPDANILTGTAS